MDKQETAKRRNTRNSVWVTAAIDAIILVCFSVFLVIYINNNSKDSYKSNVESITSITSANASLVQSALDRSSQEVKRAFNYCNGKTIEEILEYLSKIKTEDEEYQLITYDEVYSSASYLLYNGFSTNKENGEFLKISYGNSALSKSIYQYGTDSIGNISYSQSFTNKTDGIRYFAIFCGIDVVENGKSYSYFLIKPQKESVLLDQVQRYTQYSTLEVAICYADGKYLAHDNGFRGTNFYDFIYKYNDLSIDQRNEIRDNAINSPNGKGNITYLNYQQESTIYCYENFGSENQWMVVVSVIEEDFIGASGFTSIPLLTITFLCILLVFNITRLISMVRELGASVVRERKANASKSSFLSRMSHEIRTPLNAIIGYNTIARNEITEKKKLSEKEIVMKVMDCLSKSEIASKHLLTVINDVLDMSAIESGKVKIEHNRFDFKDLITSLTTIFYSQAKNKNINLEVIFGALEEEWFIGDQMRVNQVLTNILSNAVKFTPEGGSITMSIIQSHRDDVKAHIHFEIADTGIGMSKEYLAHIFTPFEQADSSISRRFGGSGLGLSISKNLVDLMDGEISVQSEQGVGTTFMVDLDFTRTIQPSSKNGYQFDKLNALIVDDDYSTCDYIALLFSRFGARCSVATSGKQAIEALKASIMNDDKYTICLVDWRMPEMDGIETVEKIREVCGNDLPIVVLSAYDYTEIAEKAKEVGVTRFISKPLFQSSLFDLLASIGGNKEIEQTANTKKYDFKGHKLLLAEDNEMNMEIASTILESTGFIVDHAWNGKQAVEEFINSPQDTYMAILMDVHMPEMNGYDATRAIRNSKHPEAKSIPIIAMTADAFAENVAEAYAAGMNAHIAKPIDIDKLFEVLEGIQKG